jgi:hypothetical protein
MVNKRLIAEMYSHKFRAEIKLSELMSHDVFSMCEHCQESPSYQRHVAEVHFLEEKIKYLDLLIDIVLSDA